MSHLKNGTCSYRWLLNGYLITNYLHICSCNGWTSFCSVNLELSCTRSSNIPLEGSTQWRALCFFSLSCDVMISLGPWSGLGGEKTFHLRIHRLVIYTKSCDIVLAFLTQLMASEAAHWRPQETCALIGGVLKGKGDSSYVCLWECMCVKIAMSKSVLSRQSSSFTV